MKGIYKFLPFRFTRINDSVLLANDVGDYYFLKEKTFKQFVKKQIDINSQDYFDLQSKFMAYHEYLPETIDLLATRYRTKKRFLYDFTSLHMFVVTHRCNNKCSYCHASSDDESLSKEYDMNLETAKKCVNLAFQSPSSNIKIEFQGGEPLLAFDAVKNIVEYANEINETIKKNVDFVICTNLTTITSSQMDYLKKNNILISTSLDGPPEIHDKCRRTRRDTNTHYMVIENLSWAMNILGRDKVTALTTVTPYNINKLHDVIDEYLRHGLISIFLRMINPYGSAIKNWDTIGYTHDEFVKYYKEALDYIIQLNIAGQYFPEEFATLLLTKIMTPFATGFVDLQSPTGVGIGGVIYEVNGDVFAADEARMLAKMTGDKTFCLGNAHTDSWHKIFCSPKLKSIVSNSCIEAIPGCAWCVYQPYCGNDPIRNHTQHGHFIGNSARTDFCHKHKAIFNIIFEYLQRNDSSIINVFWSWVTRRNTFEMNNNIISS
ncbi:MAG: His-Xaa-Ser system radical SAM maturase HxsB [Thermodesulfovibrionia bacterium]|nr:His-Xaa-Ser system radical SAM maturase HxsB [Thermodesulfovibrionia bacterium]